MNIAIVGSVDHGKSTLIGRLLYDTNSLPKEKIEEIEKTCRLLNQKLEFAYIVDALEEERKQRKTIETAQTFFRHNGKEFMIIDAPGHKEFIKNMVTGVSQADAAILIVDVNEGVTEQTKRHAYLLKLLGIKDVVVAINKMDVCNYSKKKFEEVRRSVVGYLNKIDLKISEIVPISAYFGDNVVVKSKNMTWYNGKTILESLLAIDIDRKTFEGFRMIIQDFYSVNGMQIYVGNILRGSIKKGDCIKVYPSKTPVKIGKIVDYKDDLIELEEARSPKAIGIVTDKKLKRGDILADSDPIVTKVIEALVFCLTDKIEEGKEYIFRCATQEVLCKITKVIEKVDIDTLAKESSNIINEIEIGKVLLEFDKEIVVEKFDKVQELGRFVLVKNNNIIAGGIIA